ncbi:MAG: asparagine--tRNA ligase [Armatimonadetes bacterium]|nr:asparagine--tRNA ligase [Armatimonadota bacterium]
MHRVFIKDLALYEGKEVKICGWLYNKRSSGKIFFLIIRDGTGIVQVIVSKNDISPEIFEASEKITQESSCEIIGIVKKEPRSPGGIEIILKDLKIIQISLDYPISPKEHGTDFLMDHRHLWLRSLRQQAILKIRSELIKASRDYFDKEDYVLIDAPILTPSSCEDTTTLFKTDYFGEDAYLSQSGQLYNEAAAMAFGKVYCFGPTFRAEKSKTRRHLMEFWMIEPEIAFCRLEENMQIQENFISFIIQRILSKLEKELIFLGRNLEPLKKVIPPFPRISYDEALEILRKSGIDFKWGGDFGGGDETILAENFDKPFFVSHFPAICKAFYMKQDNLKPELALASDLLAPEGYGEIIGGGEREDNLEILKGKIKAHNLNEEAYKWYLDLRSYGSVPHSGFGMGIERCLSWICGLEHVRESIPFPRMLTRLYP